VKADERGPAGNRPSENQLVQLRLALPTDICPSHGSNGSRPCTCATYNSAGGTWTPSTFMAQTAWTMNHLDQGHTHWFLLELRAKERASRGLSPYVPSGHRDDEGEG
jgi:hypothetical protein